MLLIKVMKTTSNIFSSFVLCFQFIHDDVKKKKEEKKINFVSEILELSVAR